MPLSMRWALVVAVLALPAPSRAQRIDVSMPSREGPRLDLSGRSTAELEAMLRGAELEAATRRAELPGFEVGPAILIPLGGVTLTVGVTTTGLSLESPVEVIYTGISLLAAGALTMIAGLVWLVERGVTTRSHPSYRLHRYARHRADQMRRELRERAERRSR